MSEDVIEIMADGLNEFEEDLEEEKTEDLESLFHDLYVEISTDIIYEAQLFETFCLVRPASPNMYGGIKKLSHVEMAKYFREFGGDPEEVRKYLREPTIDHIIE